MEISSTDIEKIKLITVSAQVNDLVALLYNIDKESLAKAINSLSSVEPNENYTNYRLLVLTMDFYNIIQKEMTRENETQDTHNN